MITQQSLILMLLSSAIVFGYTYGLDLIQALEVPFREEPFCLSTFQFNLMYFFTFLPIFLFNIPIGTIIDRNPVTISLFFLLISSLLAELIGTMMVQFRPDSYLIGLYVIRALFGLAGEGIFVVQSIIVTRYCQKEDFQMVLSLCLSLPFVLDSVNSIATTHIYDATHNISDPWYASAGVCGLSLLCGLIIYKRYISKEKNQQNRESLLSQSPQRGEKGEEIVNQEGTQEEEEEESFNLREIRSFSKVFWVLILAELFTEVSLGSFNDNLNDLIVKRFNIPYADAGILLVIPFASVAILSILFSIVMNKHPKTRRTLMVASTVLYLVGQIVLYFLPDTQEPTAWYYVVISFFCLTNGFGFAILFSGLQAAIPYVVEKKTIGTAYGVLGCAVGFSQCLMPFVNIAIIDSDPDLSISYTTLNLFYIGFATISLSLAVYIKCGAFESVDQKFSDLQEDLPEEEPLKINSSDDI